MENGHFYIYSLMAEIIGENFKTNHQIEIPEVDSTIVLDALYRNGLLLYIYCNIITIFAFSFEMIHKYANF